MTSELRDECRVTVDGVAPSLIRMLRNAADIATGAGRNWVGIEDIYVALTSDELAPMWWPREGKEPIVKGRRGGIAHSELEGETVPLSYSAFQRLTREWLPGPTPKVGPTSPVTVSYELSGPHEEEFRRMIERR
ncbi:hypothetical protein [Nocardia sp. NPDC056000]|uniref:hypothetical protein n=1 Tax=Nocardia sp. NPDC056000 TaxID=3345674 RepID=UPI0035DFF422